MPNPLLIDPFGRKITYLRISVTDRCDFRCSYCMAEDMTFLPRSEVLDLEELDQIASAFIERGVKKIRLTGGEPLVRRGVMGLVKSLSRHCQSGALDELTLTTNASQLYRYSDELAEAGISRINVSLDTLKPETFKRLTKNGDHEKVMQGIGAAKKAGIKIKINTVALKGINDDEFNDIINWCGDNGFDMTFIETMPLGDIGELRADHHLPLDQVRGELEKKWSLSQSSHNSGGPSKYFDIGETKTRLGFITPLSEHFCDTCNRMRLTCTGKLYMCLGQDSAVDLREPLRSDPTGKALGQAIEKAISLKPLGHNFEINAGENKPALSRYMSVTGG
ncbi:MAG: GTP 3',8-cyclase MoaA [Rhodospirillaceae bacterium]|nr:GTP 3',8-cyclase MoaA [Rhodospirillaceae bacterium]